MINNFPDQTKPLTDYERNTLLPVVIRCLKAKVGESQAITNLAMCRGLINSGYKSNSPRMRAIIHHIRVYDIIPLLVSTSKGYYVSKNENEVRDYIESLEQRIGSICIVKNALKRQLEGNNFNGQGTLNF